MTRRTLLTFALFSVLLVAVLAVTPRPSPAQEPQIVNQETVVVRAYFDEPVKAIQYAAERAVWEVDFDKQFLIIDATPTQLRDLEQRGFRVEVDPDLTASVQRVITGDPTQLAGIPGYPCYRTVEETFDTALAIVAAHPDLAEWIDVGDSWEKVNPGQGFPGSGYDMMVLRLTNFNIDPTDKPKLFITSAIHAREYTPAELNTRFAEYLVDNYGIDADATWLLDHHDIHLMLQANPDGRKQAETGLLWRKNANNDYCSNTNSRGADLNRNFVFQWGCCGGSSGSQCSETYRGASPGSEPETQAIINHMDAIFPDQRGPDLSDPAPADATGVYLDIHSYSELVLWPWGFTTTPAPNSTALQTLGRKFAYYNDYYPEQAIGLYPTDGTTDDHIYGELGVAGYTFELGTAFFQSCSTFENTILPDNMEALIYAAKVARTPYLTAAGPDALNVAVTPGAVAPGASATLAATLDDTRYSNANGTEPTQNIGAAEYYIDTPPWEAGAVAISMSPSDGSFNTKVEGATATINTTGLSNGRHTIFVRGRDINNNWGPVSAAFLYILDPITSPKIEGVVTEAGTGAPLAATVTAGSFSTTSDPITGFYQLLLVAGTYDVTASAADHADQTVNDISVVDNQTVTQNFSLTPICAAFSDDVESGNIGWTAATPWAITSENAHSPSNSWTDSPGGNYSNNRNTSLTSPVLDLSDYTNVELNFWQICDTEAGYDYCRVEISTNGGSTWTEVAAYDGSSSTWEEITLATPSLDGQASARVRFRFTSDGSVVDDGWHLDDIVVRGSGAACGGAAPEGVIYTSPTGSGTVDGVAYTSGDILAYDQATDAWSMFVDDATTLVNGNLNGFAFLADGRIMMSYLEPVAIPGTPHTADDSDIILYIPTTNSFRYQFDGSDVDLSTATEDLDALALSTDGRVLMSTSGAYSVSGLSGDGEDLLKFINTGWGGLTQGTWEMFLDGSSVGLGNIKGAWAHCNGTDIYLALDDYAGNGAGIYIYNLTTGTVDPTPYWVGADGYTISNVDGIELSLPACGG